LVLGRGTILATVRAEWDAATYDRVADPQARWGREVLARLPLNGDERVLDAGCGSGRVTEQLLERLPRGHVVALDNSPAMLDEARRRLAPYADRVDFVQADLHQPLPVRPAVDAILSTATFHWVLDHDALFRNLAAVLRAGGRLAAQCGGKGNVASVDRVLAEFGESRAEFAYFAEPDETERRLRNAGFADANAWLEEKNVAFDSRPEFEMFLATVVLRVVLARRPPSEHKAFVSDVVDRLGKLELDYVRLNIDAVRG
jgi:trans-aconitate 2-methyltransferase